MKNTLSILALSVAATCTSMFVSSQTVSAAPITGTYDARTVDGSKTTPTGITTGPWVLTSNDATASWLRKYFAETPTFASLTDLNVTFVSPEINAQVNSDGPVSQTVLNTGGGQGAPRLTLALDSNNDNDADQFIDIHLGTSPSFVDDPTALTLLSGMNLLNNDAGRYDLTNAGGSVFTNYTAALSLVGNSRILRGTVFLDSFGGNDKTLGITSIGGSFTEVPEPATAGVLAIAAVGLLARRRRRA